MNLDYYADLLGEEVQKNYIEQYKFWIKKQVNKHYKNGSYITKEDLTRVGEFAVIKALNSYDKKKGTKLSTHIMNQIVFDILNTSNESTQFNRSQENIMRAVRQAFDVLGKSVTPKELSKYLKENHSDFNLQLSDKRVENILELMNIQIFSSYQKIRRKLSRNFGDDDLNIFNEIDFEDNNNYYDFVDNKLLIDQILKCSENYNNGEKLFIKGSLVGQTMEDIARNSPYSASYIKLSKRTAIKKLQEELCN